MLKDGKASDSFHCLRVEFEFAAWGSNERQLQPRDDDVVIRPCQSEKLGQLGGFADDSKCFPIHFGGDPTRTFCKRHDGLQLIQETFCHECVGIPALAATVKLQI